ncbi:MAG: alpha/beta hydrolase [Gordonia sp. (in: high G+C Gram-positive bacteria)]
MMAEHRVELARAPRKLGRRLAQGAALMGAGAAGLFVADAALVMGALVRAAFALPRPVDDGPDPLLAPPREPLRSSVVGTHDGVLLHVETSTDLATHSSDEVLVLVHGWTCNTRFWNAQLNHYAGRMPIIAYDQRGHGLSELGPAKATIEMLGQDLQAVLEQTLPPGKRAILVGHSMGGMAIMSWAAQYSSQIVDQVAGIVLTSTTSHDLIQQQRLTPPNLPRFTHPVNPAIARAFTSSPVPLPSNGLTNILAHYIALGTQTRAAHVAFTDELIAGCPPLARAAWGSAMYYLNVTAGLRAINVPTAVVVGTDDRLTPVIHSEYLAASLRANDVLHSYTEFPGAGHMVTYERGEEYNVLLDGFIEDIVRTTAS